MKYTEAVEAARLRVAQSGGFFATSLPVKPGVGGILIPYKGINVVNLGLVGYNLCFPSVWGTPNGLRNATGKLVTKGSKSLVPVVYAGPGERRRKTDDKLDPEKEKDPKAASSGEDEDTYNFSRVYKTFPAFNAAQLDGVEFEPNPVNPGGGPGIPALEECSERFGEVLAKREIEPRPGQKMLTQAQKLCAMSLARAFVGLAQGKQVEVIDPQLWASTPEFLAIVGVAQELYDSLCIPPSSVYAFGVPKMLVDQVPEKAPDLPEDVLDQIAAPKPETEPEPKPDKESRVEQIKAAAAAFLDW